MEDIDKNKLIELFDAGLNNKEISKIIGCDRNTVRRRLKKIGIIRVPEKAHPNLNEEYFDEINSKEKAYWFGFLCADGYIYEPSYCLVLDLAKKDLNQVEKFCDVIGANKEKIKTRIHKTGHESVSVRITNRRFVESLIDKGCGNKKTNSLRLPHLRSEELDLAFLMGYYDGDGFAKSTALCSANKQFLSEIKEKYEIEGKVYNKKGSVFILVLGSDLKIKMMKNYIGSMPRKRYTYSNDQQHKLMGKPLRRKRKFEISKEDLENLISNNSYEEIGRNFGVSGNAIKKRARLLGITLKKRRS